MESDSALTTVCLTLWSQMTDSVLSWVCCCHQEFRLCFESIVLLTPRRQALCWLYCVANTMESNSVLRPICCWKYGVGVCIESTVLLKPWSQILGCSQCVADNTESDSVLSQLCSWYHRVRLCVESTVSLTLWNLTLYWVHCVICWVVACVAENLQCWVHCVVDYEVRHFVQSAVLLMSWNQSVCWVRCVVDTMTWLIQTPQCSWAIDNIPKSTLKICEYCRSSSCKWAKTLNSGVVI